MKMRGFFGLAALVSMGLTSTAALAERSDRVLPARLIARDACPIEPAPPDEGRAEAAFLAALAAPFIGDLAGAGVNMLAGALKRASEERGFVAEGRTGFYFYRVDRPAGGVDISAESSQPLPPDQLAGVHVIPTCFVLYLPSATPGNIAPPGVHPDNLDGIRSDFAAMGITNPPAVYAEIELLPALPGTLSRATQPSENVTSMMIRPRYVWYNQRFRGAPRRAARSELHVSFGTPGYSADGSPLGTVFATARIVLPRMAAGTHLGRETLQYHDSVFIPRRPTAGSTANTLQRHNTAYTNYNTRISELRNAQNEAARSAAQTALGQAVTVAASLTEEATGATNTEARFVVIRDPNRFGLAVAEALGARAEAVDTAVTNALTPSPEWTAEQTAYIRAITAIEAKEREIAAAVAAGNDDDIARLNGELRVLQGSANEAAVAINRSVPYPNLLN